LPKWNAVVLVHGCFWHRHDACRFATSPDTRSEFWVSKFAATVQRDLRNQDALQAAGWRTATVWECALKQTSVGALNALERWLRSDSTDIKVEGPASRTSHT
jgi:DNA mismatch endonuclease (patch repair protein)